MDCVYINLASRPDRRAQIESNFARHHAPGWTLARFEAVDVAQVQASGIGGAASPAEKACFASHRDLIRQRLSQAGPLMVLEDDALFGAKTCSAIDQSLSRLRDADWDIIFTDICVSDVGAWPDLVRRRRQFDKTGGFSLLGLSRFTFAGATSYILNGRSKRLLSELLDGADRIDAPYDIHLRSLVHQGRLKAFAIFPFVTSISDLAEQSSVQAGDVSLDLILNGFRRAVWVERDLDQAAARVAPLRQAYGTPETAVFAGLFEAMLSDRIGTK